MKPFKINLLILSLILIVFTSCSGGGSANNTNDNNDNVVNNNTTVDNDTTLDIEDNITQNIISANEKVAIFIDDVVEGIEYRNNGKVRYTNEKGEFYYIQDEATKFYIGNILIGEVNKIPEDNFLFIQDILDIDRTISNNNELLQISGFLQALDSNKSTDNIVIKKEDLNKFKNNHSNILDINVTEVLNQQNIDVVPTYKIIEHLQNVNNRFAFNKEEKSFLSHLFKTQYLWNDNIQEQNNSKFTNPNQMIQAYRYDTLDKWSYAQTTKEYEEQSTQTTDGFGCYYNYNKNTDINTIVNVQRGSPCDTSGLLRGDILLLINDKDISSETYGNYANDLGKQYKFTIDRPLNDGNGSYETMNIHITPNKFQYKVSQREIFKELSTNKNIGHFIYDSFSALSTIEIDETFEHFKDNNISELIIDLRYNGGGQVNAAHYLLNHLKNQNVRDTLFTYKHNNLNTQYDVRFEFFEDNSSLNLDRVIFLTSQNTASASELVINAIKPYTDVVIIGDKTHGKPVGMYGMNISDNFIYWLINFSIENANGEGNYYNGMQADCVVEENINFQRYNIDDKLVNEALYYIKNSQCNTYNEVIDNNDFVKISDNAQLDSDNDGVMNSQDAFPLDIAASVDSDNDGFPDSWNDGYTQADSTTGLILDEFPNIHTNYILDTIKKDTNGIIYLLSKNNKIIFRWDSIAKEYTSPIFLKDNVNVMEYSSNHNRLYLGYENGEIRYIDVENNSIQEQSFSTISTAVSGIVEAGNYIFVQDGKNYPSHLIFAKNNTIVYQTDHAWINRSENFAWDSNKNRIYLFDDGSTGDDIQYEIINQNNGEITYHYSQYIDADVKDSFNSKPIVISPDGSRILIEEGHLYDTDAEKWLSKTTSPAKSSQFRDNNELIYADDNNGTTLVKRNSDNSQLLEIKSYNGSLVKIIKQTNDNYLIITKVNSQLVFNEYIPSNDSDNDGVINSQDAFPLDISASVDSDNDGYPDSWNAGYTREDSITGLSLDYYPNEYECNLQEHGDGATCDVASTIPNYSPSIIKKDTNGILYLLSNENNKIFRWDSSLKTYLGSIVLEDEVKVMEYSSNHNRLYLGYESGVIEYIDIEDDSINKQNFTTIDSSVTGLLSVGNYIYAQNGARYPDHITIDKNGSILFRSDTSWANRSNNFAYDDNKNRIYLFNDGSSDDDIKYEIINQDNGELDIHYRYRIDADTQYSFDSNPIIISPDGTRVLIEEGDIYDTDESKWIASTNSKVESAIFTDNNELIYAYNNNGNTRLNRVSEEFNLLEIKDYNGSLVKIIELSVDNYLLITKENNSTIFNEYTPNNDSDDDGVLNNKDKFPLDISASVDRDNDGYPDSWNDGYSQSDSTSNLVLDYYPNEYECNLEEHGDGTTCDIASTIPNYSPSIIKKDTNGILYLLSNENNKIFRWDSSLKTYLGSIVLEDEVKVMEYSSNHNRLYLGYESGVIEYIDIEDDSINKQHFTTIDSSVTGLLSVGNYIYVQNGVGYPDHITIDRNGSILFISDTSGANRSNNFAYDDNKNRIYLFHDGSTDDDIKYEIINQNNGELDIHYQYHIDADAQYSFDSKPIIISPDGSRILIEEGQLYDTDEATWLSKTTSPAKSAEFRDNNELIYAYESNGNTVVKRNSTNFQLLEIKNYTGSLVKIIKQTDDNYLIITKANSQLVFNEHTPSNDSDNDGVINSQDAFPLDIAASVDSDIDGYPDSWNDGYTQEDSITGLKLDYYPDISECNLLEHGDGTTCNIASTIPNYSPSVIKKDTNGIVYLLSNDNNKIFRWNSNTKEYITSIILKDPVNIMEYSSNHNRIYLGYDNGEIRYIDVENNSMIEQSFFTLNDSIGGISEAGNYILAQTDRYNNDYVIINKNAEFSSSDAYYKESDYYEWDNINNKIYMFKKGLSPNDLHYISINQDTGAIDSRNDTPYHGDYTIKGPIIVSKDGENILLGSGDIYNQSDLTIKASIDNNIKDAVWTNDGELIYIYNEAGTFILKRLDADLNIIETKTYNGEALNIFEDENNYFIITKFDSQVVFNEYTIHNNSSVNTIIHNGYAYKEILSSVTNKTWLDRNLGANQICTSRTDLNCIGNYFQWGRNSDGHEIYNSETTTTKSTSVNNNTNKFVITYSIDEDWLSGIDNNGTIRKINWSKTDGSNACPKNFRVPSKQEWQDETINANINTREDMYNSFLKLPSTSSRHQYSGGIGGISYGGTYWTNTVEENKAYNINFYYDNTASFNLNSMATGHPVRCIKN